MDPDPSCIFLLTGFGYPQVISLVTILILLVCSALISGSEVALFSLKPTDFPKDRESFTPHQQILVQLLDRPKRLLATILVANTFVNIAIVLIFDQLGSVLFGQLDISFWGLNLEFILKVIVATFLILLFGEILPKIYANRKNVEFADFMAVPLKVLHQILGVFNRPMGYFTERIHDKLGSTNEGLSVDQLSKALDLTDEEETSEEEQEFLKSIVSFGNIETKQVMHARVDIFALSTKQSFKEVLDEIVNRGFSRIPVYEESLDEVKGILYIKDLLPYLDKKKFDWPSLIREPYFVPENKKLDDLLNEFKEKKNHLAIVVDEYGGTSGLISMEDIMEEIVGEISDEFDDEEEELIYSKLDENNFILEGKTPLVDFYRIAAIDRPQVFEENKGDSETVAGFLLEISGDFPDTEQEIKFENYTFIVEAIDEKRIKQVKFSKG